MRHLHAPGLGRRGADPGRRDAGSVWYFCCGWRHTGQRGSHSAHRTLGHADEAGYSHEHEPSDLPRDPSDENPDSDAHARQLFVGFGTRAFWRNADAAAATDAACFEPIADVDIYIDCIGVGIAIHIGLDAGVDTGLGAGVYTGAEWLNADQHTAQSLGLT